MLQGSYCRQTGGWCQGKYYTIYADEATDCSLKEQIALIFRFVDMSSIIREKFVSFLECSFGLSSQSLLKKIKEFLDGNDIYISDCRDQGYDGAGSVTGKNQGLAAHVLRIPSKAFYTHCFCHHLSLAVVASCGEQHIWNLIININEISYFFNFPVPWNNCLKEKMQFCPDSSKHKLKEVCRTRYVEVIEGMFLRTFLFLFIIRCLQWKKTMK